MEKNESINYLYHHTSYLGELGEEEEDDYFFIHQSSLFLTGKIKSQQSYEKFYQEEQDIYFLKDTKETENTNNHEEIKANKNENIKELEELNNNDNQQKKFNSVKKGRPKKNQRNKQEKYHNKNSYDNARRKIFNSCKMSIYDYIEELINVKLHVPTIEKQMGYSYKNYHKFINKTIYEIYCDSLPKRVKDELKNNKEKYNYNKIQINQLLEEESNNPKIIKKILNCIFNLSFCDFLLAYLNDEREIQIGEGKIYLKGFKTFGECFNERKNYYTQSQKNLFKKHILDIIADNKNHRKPRAINQLCL